MAEVKSQDLDVAHQGDAIYSNRVLVEVGPLVRIAFVEQFAEGAPPIFRTAVALPHQTAVEFANVLKVVLKDIEAQIQAAIAAQTAGSAAATIAKSDG